MKAGSNAVNWFEISDSLAVPSPGLLIYHDRVEQNVRRILAIARHPGRLRQKGWHDKFAANGQSVSVAVDGLFLAQTPLSAEGKIVVEARGKSGAMSLIRQF